MALQRIHIWNSQAGSKRRLPESSLLLKCSAQLRLQTFTRFQFKLEESPAATLFRCSVSTWLCQTVQCLLHVYSRGMEPIYSFDYWSFSLWYFTITFPSVERWGSELPQFVWLWQREWKACQDPWWRMVDTKEVWYTIRRRSLRMLHWDRHFF